MKSGYPEINVTRATNATRVRPENDSTDVTTSLTKPTKGKFEVGIIDFKSWQNWYQKHPRSKVLKECNPKQVVILCSPSNRRSAWALSCKIYDEEEIPCERNYYYLNIILNITFIVLSFHFPSILYIFQFII